MSFAADMRRFSAKTEKALDKTVRATTFGLFREVIQRTPVDTGRLKGNWQTSVGSPVKTTITRTDPSGGTAISEALMNGGGFGSVTYMTNNLPYASRIEYDGWSHTKAPEGMVRVSFARVQSIFAAAARANKV
jgi:hypothetical protein